MEPIFGVEFITERQMYQIVRIATRQKACLVMPGAQMPAESIARAMNAAYYLAIGKEWPLDAAIPYFVKRAA